MNSSRDNIIEFGGLPKKYQYCGWIRVPQGQYEATLETWQPFYFMSKPRLALIFTIAESGEYFHSHVPAFFGINKIIGTPRERGRFKAAPRGDLIDCFYRLKPNSHKVRLDRIPLTKLNDIYKIKVVDVLKNRKQKEHPEQLIYSKVIEIERE